MNWKIRSKWQGLLIGCVSTVVGAGIGHLSYPVGESPGRKLPTSKDEGRCYRNILDDYGEPDERSWNPSGLRTYRYGDTVVTFWQVGWVLDVR